MGWSSANSIFDPIAESLISSYEEDDLKTEILVSVIKTLQNNDWDTEGESVDLWNNYPFIIEAFRNCGVRIECKCQCCDHEGDR